MRTRTPLQRRNNAPVRPPQPPATIPDIIIALSASAMTMAIVFLALSFINVTGQAGAELARLFAASLLASALFLFALGFGLLGDDRADLVAYALPGLVGVTIGGLVAACFLAPALNLIPAPFVLLVVLLGPIRRRLERMAAPGRGQPR